MLYTNERLAAELPIASNINYGANPEYGLSNFVVDFPQFETVCTGDSPTVPATLSQKFIDMANTSLSYNKYGEVWSYCMGLYVAHFCTLFLQTSQGTTSKSILSGASPKGLQTSKSVGDVSTSYDTTTIANDLQNFGSFKSTVYGQQLATFAKMAGMGGMYVW